MAFEEDCANGTLPAVSWLFLTSVASEHPSYLPAAGAQFVASKIEALTANQDLWNSTVLILNYDENDGLFDHVPPITPPPGTVDEFVTLNSPGGTPGGGLPVGSGFRVPAIIVSPWTVGSYVCTATAAELAYQTSQSKLPVPSFPGRVQTVPAQDPGSRPTIG
jgi:phospholipase C